MIGRTSRIRHVRRCSITGGKIRDPRRAEVEAKAVCTRECAARAAGTRDRGWTRRRGRSPGWRRRCCGSKRRIRDTPKVTIVIPSAGRSAELRGRTVDLLSACSAGDRARTTWQHYEILIADNGDLRAETLAALAPVPHRRITYRQPEGPFNFSHKLNFPSPTVRPNISSSTNDDIEMVTPGWIEGLPRVCAVARGRRVRCRLMLRAMCAATPCDSRDHSHVRAYAVVRKHQAAPDRADLGQQRKLEQAFDPSASPSSMSSCRGQIFRSQQWVTAKFSLCEKLNGPSGLTVGDATMRHRRQRRERLSAQIAVIGDQDLVMLPVVRAAIACTACETKTRFDRGFGRRQLSERPADGDNDLVTFGVSRMRRLTRNSGRRQPGSTSASSPARSACSCSTRRTFSSAYGLLDFAARTPGILRHSA